MRLSEYLLLRLARAVIGAWALLGLEWVFFSVVWRRELASVWELQWGTVWLAPAAIAAAAVVGVLGALAAMTLETGEAPRSRLGLGVLGGALAAVVAWGVGGGRHLASLPLRGGFALGVALAVFWAGWVAAPRVAGMLRRRPTAVTAAALLGIVGLELANQYVLVRLYPAFHHGLSAVALVLAGVVPVGMERMGLIPPVGTARGGRAALLVIALAAAAVAAARPAAAKLAYFDNFRLLATEKAPLLGHAALIAAELVPPAPLDFFADECAENGADCEADTDEPAQSLLLRDRDLLLISIDALRADHVGAYGYSRKTTPHIDALARDGVLFENAFCATPHTSYSVTSLMTGKYMRPLLLQGAGQDSDTWAALMRTYGYRTAAFYPPAVFYIDAKRFEGFSQSFLGFEYRKVEFMEGDGRVAQVESYVKAQPPEQRLFTWVHLFGPHEPYESHPEHPFGDHDVDRYDSEIARADRTVGDIVKLFRERRPNTAVIVTSDHGEEFGEHGGRYHGTTVYDEQVRVPLVFSIPGAAPPRRVREVVQTIDVLPTVLAALEIPRPPRVRGRNLSALVAGIAPEGPGFAHAETEEYALLAAGPLRLVCARRLGACKLYDVSKDPKQTADASHREPGRFEELRRQLRELGASHGRYELRGLRAEGKGWPDAILRGVAGDADAAEEIAGLLDDADRHIRRKAAELLFQLRRAETAPALRLALARDEDIDVRRWSALALTRLGEGAPLTFELCEASDPRWRRLAALALAESGDARGEATLIAWWKEASVRDYDLSLDLLRAFAKIRAEDAVWPLVQSLHDVRLRPHVAAALAEIGEEVARGPLAKALAAERYQSARIALAAALVQLGAEAELAPPLVRFLGVPDPLLGGLGFGVKAGILEHMGGPDEDDLRKLRREHEVGVAIDVFVPRGGNGSGVRALVRARTTGTEPGEVLIGPRLGGLEYDVNGKPKNLRKVPRIDPDRAARIPIPPADHWVEAHGVLPAAAGMRAGRGGEVIVFASHQVVIDAVALVPLSDELPPPPPRPWTPGSEDGAESASRPDAG